MKTTESPILTNRFEKALIYATNLHQKQVRKGTNIPYVSHLLAVTALVLEDGGDENQAIAALLHDAVEDQGGETTYQEILAKFGEEVAAIVKACTDTDAIPKPPWRERKESYIEHFRHASIAARRVSLADKLHNSRSILSDWYRMGDEIWERFAGKKEGTLWYYRSLIDVSQAIGGFPHLTAELERVVTQLEKLSSLETPFSP
ncbi:HD domain-containing protein [Merismopedia glauca]|uniref:Phosphohydrolase n=1 Tax=Merismopedia glauca CCAP 1448/3 TaxID=1296344 RepID=A0A2T1BX39_9CYAN|nr:HD domain-containing protein [Merismopedia glauca]PSB00477.1 phosphohydrolase [Merismopedia glauca CCAP 1448/3]